jgi:hypothetical protein
LSSCSQTAEYGSPSSDDYFSIYGVLARRRPPA